MEVTVDGLATHAQRSITASFARPSRAGRSRVRASFWPSADRFRMPAARVGEGYTAAVDTVVVVVVKTVEVDTSVVAAISSVT